MLNVLPYACGKRTPAVIVSYLIPGHAFPGMHLNRLLCVHHFIIIYFSVTTSITSQQLKITKARNRLLAMLSRTVTIRIMYGLLFLNSFEVESNSLQVITGRNGNVLYQSDEENKEPGRFCDGRLCY
jgi:hypothetical protein